MTKQMSDDKDYKEGFLHAITAVQLHSVQDVSPVLRDVLEEEGFDEFLDTGPYSLEWSAEQFSVLRSIWKGN